MVIAMEVFRAIVTGRGPSLRARDLFQLTLWPPSTLRMWPVINEAASDAMKTIASACSAEMPRRAMGTCFQPSKEELQDGRVVRFFITDGEVDCRNLTGKRAAHDRPGHQTLYIRWD